VTARLRLEDTPPHGFRGVPEPHAELKKLSQSMHNAMTALREANENKNTETVERVQREIDRFEDEHSKFALHQKA
jgi:hypothetical protein